MKLQICTATDLANTCDTAPLILSLDAVDRTPYLLHKIIQDAQLSQRDRAAGCVIVFAKSRTLELGDNDLRTL